MAWLAVRRQADRPQVSGNDIAARTAAEGLAATRKRGVREHGRDGLCMNDPAGAGWRIKGFCGALHMR